MAIRAYQIELGNLVRTVAVEDFDCPRCHATAEERCRALRGTGHISSTHSERVEAVWEFVRQGSTARVAAARSFDCPRCEVDEGEDCRDEEGFACEWPHWARYPSGIVPPEYYVRYNMEAFEREYVSALAMRSRLVTV